MNSRYAVSGLFAAACVAAAAAAHAESFAQRGSLVLFGGGNAEMPGSFRGQTVPFESTNPPGTTVYDDLRFEDAYDHRYTLGAEYDYALSPQLAAFGRFGYSTFDGTNHVVGEFTSSAVESHPVRAEFHDTRTREFDVGARYSFAPEARFHPFVGLALGAEHLSAAKAKFLNVNDLGATDVVLGEAETVFSQRLETGLQYLPASNLGLRLSVAASHVNADTKSSDPNLALVGLENTSGEVRDHWEYPVELGAVWKF
jgi:opacity protein-like surface antigen